MNTKTMKILLKLRIKEWVTYMPVCKPRDLLLRLVIQALGFFHIFVCETKAYKGHTFFKFQTPKITENTQILKQNYTWEQHIQRIVMKKLIASSNLGVGVEQSSFYLNNDLLFFQEIISCVWDLPFKCQHKTMSLLLLPS